jgi:hypothetical protein
MPADLVLGGDSDGRGGDRAASGATSGMTVGERWDGSAPGSSAASSTLAGAIDVDLATLADHPGALVRVGGLVVEPTSDGFTLDDGTAMGTIVLRGDARDYLPLLEAGDALNAIGHVESDGKDGWVVAVDDPAGLIRVGDLGEATPLAPASGSNPETSQTATAEPSRPPVTARLAGFETPFGVGEPGAAGIASLALIAAASVAASYVRRARERRRLAARIAARLAAFAKSGSETG